MVEKAEYSLQKEDYKKAYFYFTKAMNEDSRSLQAKAGCIFSLIKLANYQDAEKELLGVKETDIKDVDELSRFRIVYSRIRVLQSQNKIQEGKQFLDQWLSAFTSSYQTLLKLEQAEFLVVEKNYSEALPIVLECNNKLKGTLRSQNLGRIFFIFVQMNKRELASRILWENIKYRPTLGKIVGLLLLNLLTKPIYISALISIWLITWYVLQINIISFISMIIGAIIFGIIPIFVLLKNKTICLFIVLFWASTIGIFYSKNYSIFIQLALLIAIIFGLLSQLIFFKSLNAITENKST